MDSSPSPTGLFPHSRLILSAGTLPRAGFEERVRAARDAGFHAISLFPQQYLAARRKEKLSVANMRDILGRHGLAVDEVDPLLDWFGPAASVSETLILEIAEGLGARSVNVAAAFVSNRSTEEVAQCFARVCQRAGRIGLRADLEFLPWTGVDSLTTALSIVEMAAQPNGGVMLDFWHLFNSKDGLDTLRALSPAQAARITSLQLNDAPATIADLRGRQQWQYAREMLQNLVDSWRILGLDALRQVVLKAQYPHPEAQQMMKDALCSRMFPGSGEQPVADALSILAEKGIAPAIGVEVFNLDHHARPAADLARDAMAGYRKVCGVGLTPGE